MHYHPRIHHAAYYSPHLLESRENSALKENHLNTQHFRFETTFLVFADTSVLGSNRLADAGCKQRHVQYQAPS